MGSYSDFMRHFGMTGRTAAYAQDIFNALYDRSHGSNRYALRNTPWGLIRYFEDKAQEAQDRWENTGIDERYASRVDGSLYGFGASVVGAGTKLPRMARSLTDLYQADVIESVGGGSQHPEFG